MPGPFDSDKTKGTFEKDISCIKQNDVWSSKTFNNFIKSFYNRYCSDANFERTFADNDRQRIALDNTSFSGSDSHDYKDTEHSIDIADALFHVNKTLKRVECYLVDRGTDISDFYYNEGEDTISVTPVEGKGYNAVERDLALEPLMRLFCGRGDVSLNIPPYAMFPVLSDTTSTTLEESRTVNSPEHDAYFCVTYSEGETTVSDPDNPDSAVTQHIVPRYATTCELVLIYDPTIVDEGNTVISRVDGNIIRETHGGTTPIEDVTTKLTLTFGQSAKLTDLCSYLNHLTCETYNKFSAKLVGNARGDQTILKALMLSDEPDTSKSITKVFRFVPIKPCISFKESTLRFLSALTAPEGEGQTPNLVESITKYAYVPLTVNNTVVPVANTDDDQGDTEADPGDTEQVEEPVERAVFVHTGTYGFILGAKNGGNPIDLPAMVNANDVQFIYIPDKLNRSHYIPSTDASSNPLPDWYKTLPAGINKAVTRDYNAEFFFIPFITITERTIEIADFIVDIDTVLELGDFITEILPGRYMPKLLESNVTYDAWWAASRSKKLYGAADQIYKKYRRGLYGVYEDETHTHRELKDLQVKRPRPNSLVRTLQIMTGLTWQLNNIVWIDPMLASADPDTPDGSSPALKMFSGYDKIFEYEDTYSGPGSILTPETTVVYLLRAYSSNNSLLFDASWSTRLPSGMHHIALNLAQDTPAVTSPDFNGTPVNYKLGTVNFRLVQPGSGPAVTDFELHRQFFDLSGLKLDAAEGFSTLKRVTLYYGSYSNITIDGAVTDTVYVVGADILKASISTAYLRLSEVKSVINTTFIPTPAVRSSLSGINTFLYLDGTNVGGMANAVVDVTFSFMDLRSGELKEARDLSQIHSLIKIGGKITGSKLRFAIKDNGNTADWLAPDGETTYPINTWQAFDPDILLPKADGNDITFPDTFMFIDCGLFSETDQGQFINCSINIDLSDDFTWNEPVGVNSYVKECRFFASRFFRKSPYVMYFGSKHPCYYYPLTETEAQVSRSQDVDMRFVLPSGTRMAIRSDMTIDRDKEQVLAPMLPATDSDNGWSGTLSDLSTAAGYHVFISGLTDSTVDLPEVSYPSAIKWNQLVPVPVTPDPESVQEHKFFSPLSFDSADVLFEAVAGCKITISSLDTCYPLKDEWEYATADYTPSPISLKENFVGWIEPKYGFQFFTSPRIMGLAPCYVNRNNTLIVSAWTTRQLVSGIQDLYDSSVSIHYRFNTYAFDLVNMSTSELSDLGPKGPVRWDLDLADPGAERKQSVNIGPLFPGIDSLDNAHVNICYLPVLPLFYLAGTNSCDIKLLNMCSTIDRGVDASPLGGGYFSTAEAGMRSRYRFSNRVPDFRPSISKRIENNTVVTYYENRYRPLRLAVGWAVPTAGEQSFFVAPSSYNTITAHTTRANLIAGVMNKVTGWCYRLHCTKTLDFTPERYHDSGTWDLSDAFDPQMPLTMSSLLSQIENRVARYTGVDGELGSSQAILDPDPVGLANNPLPRVVDRSISDDVQDRDNSGNSYTSWGTIRTRSVVKELALDLTAPGMWIYEPKELLQALSLLHADYPVMGQGQGMSDPDTLANENAVVHASSKEIGYSGYWLAIPGYRFTASIPAKATMISNWELEDAAALPTGGYPEGYAGMISEPSDFKMTLGQDQAWQKVSWTLEGVQKFYQRTPMVDALNVADLDVLLVATSDIKYVTQYSSQVTLFEHAEFAADEYTIKAGELLHTVVAQGWFGTVTKLLGD